MKEKSSYTTLCFKKGMDGEREEEEETTRRRRRRRGKVF